LSPGRTGNSSVNRPEERLAVCPQCGTRIEIGDYYCRGDIVMCDECGVEFLIRAMAPVSLFAMDRGEHTYSGDGEF